MKQGNKHKGDRFFRALPILAVALIPFSALAASRQGGDSILEDDVNSGSQFFQMEGDYNLSGVVGGGGATVSSGQNYQVVSAFIFDAPATITDLRVSTDTDSSLKLTWKAPDIPSANLSSVDGYEIRYSSVIGLDDNNFFIDGIESVYSDGADRTPGNTQSHIITGLKYNTSYYVSIVSSYNYTTSLVGQYKIFENQKWEVVPFWTLASTPAVQNVSFDPQAGRVSMTFSPRNPDNHTLTYEVILATGSSVSEEINRVPGTFSDNNEITVSFTQDSDGAALNPNRDYYFFIKVLNGGGNWTDWVSASLIYTSVDWRTTISVVQVSSNSIQLEWSPAGGPNYLLAADTYESFTNPNVVAIDGLSRTGSIPNLKANTTYYIKIVPEGSDVSVPSPYISTVTTLGVPTLVSMELDPNSKTSAIIKWQDPADMSLGDHSYIIRVSSVNYDFSDPSNYFEQLIPHSQGQTNYEATFDNLLAGNTPYYVQIVGVNRAGVQSGSQDIYSSTDPRFYTLPIEPPNVRFDSLASGFEPVNHVAISWDHGLNNPSLTKYEVQLTTTSGGWTAPSPHIHKSFVTDSGTTSTTTFVRLANQEYFARVRAIDNQTGNTPSAWIDAPMSTFTDVLGPTGLSVVNETTDTLTLQWQAVFDKDGQSYSNSPNTEYGVEYSKDINLANSVRDNLFLVSPQVVLGRTVSAPLLPNTAYYIKIYSLHSAGSPFLDAEGRTEGVTLALLPEGVTFVTYTTSATVFWTQIPETKYHIKVSNEGNDSSLVYNQTNLDSGREDIPSLHPNTTYYLQVHSINRGGKNNGSNGWEDYRQATDPAAPEITEFTLYTDSGTVRWGVGGNPEGTRYVVKYTTGATIGGIETEEIDWIQSGTGEQEVDLPNLIKNKGYLVRVDAVGYNQKEVRSAEWSKRTNSDKPTNVQLVVDTDPTREMRVTWEANGNDVDTVYDVEVSSDNFNLRLSPNSVGAMEAHFVGLKSNQKYKARVAVGGMNNWEYSGEVFTYPSKPQDIHPIAAVDDDRSHVAFEWGPGSNDLATTRYRVEVSSVSGDWTGARVLTPTPGGTNTDVDVPLANQEYFARVQAIAKDGDSGHDSDWADNTASTRTAVVEAQGLDIVSVTDDSVSLRWSGVVDETLKNADATEYEVVMSSQGWTGSPETKSGNASYEIPYASLNSDTRYTFAVQAKSAGGWPDVSKSTDGVTLAKLPTQGAYQLFESSGTVAWERNGNPADTEYVVRMSAYETFVSSFGPSAYTSGIHSATFTALTPNTTYWVRAWGKNRAGVETAGYKQWDPQATDAEKPDLQEAGFALYTDSGTVRWGVGGNPEGTRYVVKYTTGATIGGIETEEIDWIQSGTGEQEVDLPNLIKNKGYLVRVDAVGYNQKEVRSEEWSKRTNSDKPTNVQLVVDTDPTREMRVTWEANGNDVDTVYDVEVSSDNFNLRLSPNSVGAMEAHFVGLKSNQKYKARVAVGGMNNWEYSGEVFTYPSKPQDIHPIAAVDDDRSHVVFEWGPGSNDLATTRYRVEVSSISGDWTGARVLTPTPGGTNTDVDVPLANQEYFARVQAIAKDGDSGHDSDWADNTASTRTAVVEAQGLDIVSVTDDSVSLRWSGVVDETLKNADATEYEVVMSSQGWTGSPETKSGNASYEIPYASLNSDTRYTFAVQAKSAGGWPDVSKSTDGVTLAKLPTQGAYQLFESSGTVAWERNGNPADTEYVVRMSAYETFVSSFGPSAYTSGIHSATFTALTANTTYWVRAWGKNRAGVETAGYKQWDPQATDAEKPDLQEAGFALYTDSGTVRWGVGGNPEGTRYVVKYTTGATIGGIETEEIDWIQSGTGEQEVDLPNLIKNKGYLVRVDAVGYNQKEVRSAEWSKRTNSDKPTNVQLVVDTDPTREMRVTWEANGNDVDTVYDVEVSSDNFNLRLSPNSVGAMEAHFVGLKSNQKYKARVAVGGMNNWEYSGEVFTYPSKPQDIHPIAAVDDDRSHVVFEWGPGSNDLATTRYRVEVSSISGDWTGARVLTPTPGGTNTDVDVPLANQEYFARVQAIAKDGDSGHDSDWADNTASTRTAVVEAQGLDIVSVTDDSVSLRWSGVVDETLKNADATEYEVVMSSQGWTGSPETKSGNASYEIPYASLNSDTRYTFAVQAKSAGGWPDVSKSTDGVTLAKLPTQGAYQLFESSGTVAWERNGNPADTEYVVRMSAYETFVSSFGPSAYTSGIHSATFTALTPNTTYWVRAWGKNRAGIETVDYAQWEAQATDAAVPLLTNLVMETTSGKITWNPNGNPAGTRYNCVVGTESSLTVNPKTYSVPDQTDAESAAKSFTFDQLTPNLPYYVRVDALGHNKGVVSSTVSFEVESNPADVESIGLEPVGDQTRELKLTWDKKGNSDRTQYAVELTTNVTGLWKEFPYETNKSEYVFDQLNSNKQYFARVKVVGGIYSDVKSAYTWPAGVVNLSSAAVSASEATHAVKFKWEHGTNAVDTKYSVTLSTGVTQIYDIVKDRETGVGDQSIEFSASDGVVWANQKYDVTVKAISNGNTPNGLAVSTVGYTAPLAVQSLEIVKQSTHSINVKWGDPKDGGVVNEPDTRYLLNWRELNEQPNAKLLGPGQGSYEEVVGGLKPNTTYYLQCAVLAPLGSPWASAVRENAAATNPTKPELKLGNVIPHTSSMTVLITANGNPPGTLYEVEFVNGDPSGPSKSFMVRDEHFVTPEGELSPANLYVISVTAIGHNENRINDLTRGVSQATLPEAAPILRVEKPDPDAGGHRLVPFWGSGRNGTSVSYSARSSNSTPWGPKILPSGSSEYSAELKQLSPNVKYTIQVKASAQSNVAYEVISTTEAWSRANRPGIPGISVPLSNKQLGIRFGTDGNPDHTEYAIRLATADVSAVVPTNAYADLDLAGKVSGEALFTSQDPVWKTVSQWNGGSILLGSLPTSGAYKIVLYARNGAGEVESGVEGLPVEQSVGVPHVTLETAQGIKTPGQSKTEKVYVSTNAVPFEASNSSHFNVEWGETEVAFYSNMVNNTHGWNGKITKSETGLCLSTGPLNNPIHDGSFKGFCAEEGEYYLNVVGTALVATGGNVGLLLRNSDLVYETTDTFRVYIDTTAPVARDLEVYFSSEAARARNVDQRISTGTWWGDPNPYVTWDPTDLLGKAISRSPVVGWTVSWSTDPAVWPSTGVGDVTPDVGFEMDLTGVKESKTYYIRVRGYDLAGNWTADKDVPEFIYQYTPDQIAPRWSLNHITMTGVRYPATDQKVRYAAVAAADNFVDIGFEEEMLIPRDSIQLVMHRDSDGAKVDKATALTLPTTSYVTVTGDSKTMIVLPFSSGDLKPASMYRFYSSTKPAPTDRANNALQTPLDLLFYTAMDPAQKAVFVSEDGRVKVSVPAGALGAEPVGVAINDRPEKVSVAGAASLPGIVDKATESMGRQTGGAFKKIFSIKELSVFDTKGKMRSAAYGGDVRLSFDITNDVGTDNGTSYMKGTSIRAKDLAIYELDPRTGVWNKMPDAQVDEVTGTVSVPLRHNGTYALGGAPNYDLSNAHAYPVPYRAQRDQNGISFTGLSSFGTIKIFTLDGRLVKTLSYDGVSSVDWNPVTSDGGQAVGSDVYLYVIENDQQRKVGKLMVIR